jgi:AcrR family transcriptional regulator
MTKTSIDFNPSRPAIYSSEVIQERRKRILRETRMLIAEDGIERFSIRRLCLRAEVAQRTLYNAFGNKDRMIALAIQEAFVRVYHDTRFNTPADTLDGMLNRLIHVQQRNFFARNYTKAVVSIYFSPNTHRDIWVALQEMSFLSLREWFARLIAEGEFQPWVVPDEAAADIANIEYSIINDWAHGHISDDDYIRRLVVSVLSYTLGATRGRAHKDAQSHLQNIHETGLAQPLLGEIRLPSPGEKSPTNGQDLPSGSGKAPAENIPSNRSSATVAQRQEHKKKSGRKRTKPGR